MRANMAEVFEKALDMALEKKDPKCRLERRREREESRLKPRPEKVARAASSRVRKIVEVLKSCQGLELLLFLLSFQ